MIAKTERQCRRCGNVLDTSGARGLCLSCLSLTTTHRFTSSEVDGRGEDLKLEEGVSVGPQDRFLLHDRLGVGGMGEVWLATDLELSREDEPYWVALKFLSESIRTNKQALAAVRTEVIRSQEMNHPNIVRVFDLHTTAKGMPFIKMEYVKGKNLVYWLEDCPNGVMHWREVVEITQQLCNALQYAHETGGVVHRDIKPGNLLLRTDRILKVADFGIAEALYTTRAVSLKQKTLGTIWYASPQQLVGQRPTPADDIHALGATLYELLAGEPPFTGDNADHTKADSAEALIHQVRFDPAEPIRQRLARRGIENEIPPKLVTLIHRCLEKEPQARPLAREILAMLPTPGNNAQALAAPAPPQATPRQPARQAPKTAPTITVPQIPAERWEADTAPEKSRSAVMTAFLWILFLGITGAAGFVTMKQVNAQPPVGTLEVDLSGLPETRVGERTVVLKPEDRKGREIQFALAASESKFQTNISTGAYLVTVTDTDGLVVKLTSDVKKGSVTTAVIREDLPKVGTLKVDLSEMIRLRQARRTISITTADGTEIQSRTVESDEPAEPIPFTVSAGEYTVNIKEASGYEVFERAKVGQNQTITVRPKGEIPKLGSVAIDLRSFASRNKPRRVEIRKQEGGQLIETIPVTATQQPILRDLAVGAYEIRMVETLNTALDDNWVVQTNITVAAGRPNPVVLGYRMVSVRIESNLTDTLVTWAVGLTDTNSIRLGPSRVETKLLPTGIFLVHASHDNCDPVTMLFTNTAAVPTLRITMRSGSKLTEGLDTWANSLDMRMVRIRSPRAPSLTNKWVSVMETRVRDFSAFVDDTRRDMSDGLRVVTTEGVKLVEKYSWKELPPGFDSNPLLPVVGVNLADANQFCEWLTQKEQKLGLLAPNFRYRLPNSKEWFELAGGMEYPWGDNRKKLAGNYSGTEVRNSPGWPPGWLFLKDYSDGYARLAPAANEFINFFGLYHVGGNAAEWTSDKTVAGGSWADGAEGDVVNDLPFLRTDNFRNDIPAEERNDRVGFRALVEMISAKEQAAQ
jgi:serine/threonine protein kinase